MEQTADQEATTDVAVIGGGLAGLAAAATAARAGATVTVLEGHGLGGRARVDRRGGFTFNRGPRALYLGGPGRRILSEPGAVISSDDQVTFAIACSVVDGLVASVWVLVNPDKTATLESPPVS